MSPSGLCEAPPDVQWPIARGSAFGMRQVVVRAAGEWVVTVRVGVDIMSVDRVFGRAGDREVRVPAIGSQINDTDCKRL